MASLVEEIRKDVKRHRGAIALIAGRAGRHRDWVWRVLTGKYKDLRVLEIAALVVEELDKEGYERLKAIKESRDRKEKSKPRFLEY